jgi:hypothetical protein
MSDDSIFGPDHDRAPGIEVLAGGQMPPPLIEWMTESSAMHTRSRGWLPAVIVKMATLDGAAMIGIIECGPELDDIIQGLVVAKDRAVLDVQVGIADGTLP